MKKGSQVVKVGKLYAGNDKRRRWWNSIDAERTLRHADPVQQDLIDDDCETEQSDER